MKVQQKTNKKPLKIILVLVAVLLLGAAGWTAYAYSQNLWPFPATQTEDAVDNGSPLTPEQEAEESQQAKKDAQEEQPPKQDEAGKNVVSVGVAFADVIDGAVEIRAFTPSVVEGNGTCAATLTKGSLTVSDQTNGFIDSTTTQCEPIRIPLDEFTESGDWELVVRYSSAKSQGSSETIEVTIP